MYYVHACSKVCTVAVGDLRHANANCLWMEVCTKYAAKWNGFDVEVTCAVHDQNARESAKWNG